VAPQIHTLTTNPNPRGIGFDDSEYGFKEEDKPATKVIPQATISKDTRQKMKNTTAD